MSKTQSFSIRAHLREYIYTAKVNALTGELVEITAGCRHWTSFAQARKHYDGKPGNPSYGSNWRDDNNAHLNGTARDRSTELFFYRLEARIIIDRLDVMVRDYCNRHVRKAKLIEQAKKPVKKVAKKPVKKVAKKPVKKVAKKKTK